MNIQNAHKQENKSQRGAALVTVLMMSTLLLATGGALVLVTSLSNRTAIDATAEMQAYYSAEAGVQDVLNVLRGNVTARGAMPANSTINFRSAIDLNGSNVPGDSGPACRAADPTSVCRLSGWLNYNYASGNGPADRVALTANYSPLNGLAYSVRVSDPDNTPIATGEPTRLLVRVRGFGPKGAEKRMEVIIKRTSFDYVAPAMLLMRGAPDCAPITFTIGNSNAKTYSGHDNASTAVLPTFGATCDGDRTIEDTSDDKETVEDPQASTIVNADLPPWLRSADDSRAFVKEMKELAIRENRYFTSYDGFSGTATNPIFTFVDGNCELDGGGGLLIVTGTLIMNGNPDFSGLILVLGEGRVLRDGQGNGEVFGAMAVAHFNDTGDFLPPYFDTEGGGTSLMKYDSAALRRALNAAGPRVMGIHEQ